MTIKSPTGRVESKPEAQNIPIRTETGKRLREVFDRQGPRVLVETDYSAIELRLWAEIVGKPAG